MRIGNIEFPIGAVLAPMAGVTDAAMRVLCHECASAWSVSEMLSAKGWVYSEGRNQATRALLTRLENEGIAGLQLFGREPEIVARAAQALTEAGFEFIDLNFGCPAPKITGNGEGSALMREPDLIGKIVSAVVKATPLPVTAKIRAGWDESCINAKEVAHICEDSGAKAVAVHARTRMQQYSGKADWSIIADVKRHVSIPVLGNGDIRSGMDAKRMIEQTGCDGVIVGRAAQGNPWIFSEIRAAFTNQPYTPPDIRQRVEMALRHFDLEAELHGGKKGLLEMRKHIAWYIAGVPGAAKFRDSINLLTDAEAVKDALREFALHSESPSDGESGASEVQ